MNLQNNLYILQNNAQSFVIFALIGETIHHSHQKCNEPVIPDGCMFALRNGWIATLWLILFVARLLQTLKSVFLWFSMLSATASQKTQDIIFHSPLHFTFYHKFTFSRTSLYKEDRSEAPLSLLTSAQTPFRPGGHIWGQLEFIPHFFQGSSNTRTKILQQPPSVFIFWAVYRLLWL